MRTADKLVELIDGDAIHHVAVTILQSMQKFEIVPAIPNSDGMVERAAHQDVRVQSEAEDAAAVTVVEGRFSDKFSISFRTFEQIFGAPFVVAVVDFRPDFDVAVVEAAE